MSAERVNDARQARLDSLGTLHHVMIRRIERGDIVGGLKAWPSIPEAGEKIKRQLPSWELDTRARKIVEEICIKEKGSREALTSGSRRGQVSRTRARLAEVLVWDMGLLWLSALVNWV